MKVEVNVDKNCEETKIIIHTKSIEDKIIKLIENLQIKETEQINGFKDDEMYILSQDNIESFYTENGKVFARINENKYLIKKRLYELEEILNPDKFLRISNSEIVNMRKVKKINLKLTGTIILYFATNNKAYVSRRYLKKIKEYLGV
jgi:DNA-binding LytR/AlgR family response regulator